jgi:hypothetical protein
MKLSLFILLHVALVVSCSAPTSVSSVAGDFVDAGRLANSRTDVPPNILKALPARLKKLSPTNQLILVDFLDQIGLRPYANNIELSRNGYDMYLNNIQSLFIECRERAIHRDDVENYVAADHNSALPRVLGGDKALVSGFLLLGKNSSVLLNGSFENSSSTSR